MLRIALNTGRNGDVAEAIDTGRINVAAGKTLVAGVIGVIEAG